MKLKASAADLTTYFGMLQNVLSRRQTIPSLGGVMVNASGSGAVLRATDIEVTHSVYMPTVELSGDGMLVPGKRFYEMVKLLPRDDVVTLTSNEKAIKVKGKKFSSTLQTYPVDDYPMMPDPGDAHGVTIPGSAFKLMLARTKFIPEEGDARYFLHGLNMLATNGQFRVVGTDGKRMSLTMQELAIGDLDPQILSQNGVNELWVMLGDYDGDVTYQVGPASLFFSTPGQRIAVQRIDGAYPSYEKVIPTDTTIQAVINRTELLDIVRRVGLVMDQTKNSIKLSFTQNQLSVSTACQDIGAADESMWVQYANPDFEVGIGAKYLAQFLRSCATEEVVMSTTDAKKIFRFEPEGESGYVHVISSMEVPK
jgi:DNA polymerase-3 subunit beta